MAEIQSKFAMYTPWTKSSAIPFILFFEKKKCCLRCLASDEQVVPAHLLNVVEYEVRIGGWAKSSPADVRVV